MQCISSLLFKVTRLQTCSSFFKFMSCTNQGDTFERDDLQPHFEIVKTPRVEYSSKHFEAISSYLDSKKNLRDVKDKLPSHFLIRKYKCPNSLYIIDDDIARNLFDVLRPHLESTKSHIVEVNAGAGVLTRHLLKSGLPRLRVYESDSNFHKALYAEILKCRSNARLFKFNILSLWTLIRLDRNDNEGRLEIAFEGLPRLDWEDEPVVKMIAVIPSYRFIMHIILSIIFQSGICEYGRPELYLAMPPVVYEKMMATPEGSLSFYRSNSVLFQLLFNVSELARIPEIAVMPWVKKNVEQKKISDKYKGKYIVMKLTARQDLFKMIQPHLLKPFWFFTRVIMQKRTEKLIVVIEKWISGGGVRLIAQGFTIYTQCGSLTPQQILSLFKEFSSWPEYESSSFQASMEGMVVRMSNPGDAELIMSEEEKVGKREDGEADDQQKYLDSL